jgi:hypothetical protein
LANKAYVDKKVDDNIGLAPTPEEIQAMVDEALPEDFDTYVKQEDISGLVPAAAIFNADGEVSIGLATKDVSISGTVKTGTPIPKSFVNIGGYVNKNSNAAYMTLVGKGSEGTGTDAVAIGNNAVAAENGVSIGSGANGSTNSNIICIGRNVNSSTANSVNLGNSSTTTVKLGPAGMGVSSNGIIFSQHPKLSSQAVSSGDAYALTTKTYVDNEIKKVVSVSTTGSDSLLTVGPGTTERIHLGFLKFYVRTDDDTLEIEIGGSHSEQGAIYKIPKANA